MSTDRKDTILEPVRSGAMTVGTTRLQVTTNVTSFIKGVVLKAKADNANPVWVGGPNVTADYAETSGGLPLAAGETVFLAIEDLSRLYVVSDAAAQVVSWIAV